MEHNQIENKNMEYTTEQKQRLEEALELISLGEQILEDIHNEMIEAREGITIHEGKCYLTRDGRIRGPMRPLPASFSNRYAWTDSAEGDVIYGNFWTEQGFYTIECHEPHHLDLISEVKTP